MSLLFLLESKRKSSLVLCGQENSESSKAMLKHVFYQSARNMYITMLQILSKCEVKAWLGCILIILQSLRFYVKSNFGNFKPSKNVIFGNFRGSQFWFLVNLSNFQVPNLPKIQSSESLTLPKMTFLDHLNSPKFDFM